MRIIKRIDAFASKNNLLSHGQTILIGLSGGPDSVFLLHYLLAQKDRLNLHLIAAHLNHEWRESAKIDEQFCIELCKELNVLLIHKKMSDLTYTIKPSGSKEQDARRARRAFFMQIAQEYKADSVALAHHRDDLEETFFIRLFRGSGLTGLVGMRPKSGCYIRPLLCINKAEILAYLAEHAITYINDPTNESPNFLRNRIRMHLMPVLREIDTRFAKTFGHTVERLQETEDFLAHLAQDAFARMAHFDDRLQHYLLDKIAFLSLDPVIRYRVLVRWLSLEKVEFSVTQAFLDEVIRFIAQPTNKTHSITSTRQIVKTKKGMYIKAASA